MDSNKANPFALASADQMRNLVVQLNRNYSRAGFGEVKTATRLTVRIDGLPVLFTIASSLAKGAVYASSESFASMVEAVSAALSNGRIARVFGSDGDGLIAAACLLRAEDEWFLTLEGSPDVYGAVDDLLASPYLSDIAAAITSDGRHLNSSVKLFAPWMLDANVDFRVAFDLEPAV